VRLRDCAPARCFLTRSPVRAPYAQTAQVDRTRIRHPLRLHSVTPARQTGDFPS
jgi:hypothetical protein